MKLLILTMHKPSIFQYYKFLGKIFVAFFFPSKCYCFTYVMYTFLFKILFMALAGLAQSIKH